MSFPTRRKVLREGLAFAALSAVPTTFFAEPVTRRPNIVILLSDDQRADSMGCSGNPILKTPNIDALAGCGVRFINSFATSAICMSSRASILTGMYTRLHGINDFSQRLDRKLFQNSYPLLLRAAGYRTGFVGKWGIGAQWLPTRDFDFFSGFSGQGSYFEPGSPVHLTTRQAALAVDFLRTCRPDQPFCLAVSFKAPHVQDEGRFVPGTYAKYPYDPALESRYLDDPIPRPRTVDAAPLPTFLDRSMNRTREGPDFFPTHYQETMRDLYRLITGVDQAVGTVCRELKRLGFAGNTVIIFSSDHGSFYGEHGFGGKWLMHEESIRTPLIISDPRVSPIHHGTTRDEMALNIDLPATVLDLAGVSLPVGMQGRSLLPLIARKPTMWRQEWFYQNHFRNVKSEPIVASEGIRTTDWKYIRYIDQQPVFEQLFDLIADPREEINLAELSQHKETLSLLRHRWSVWNQSLDRFSTNQPWTDPV